MPLVLLFEKRETLETKNAAYLRLCFRMRSLQMIQLYKDLQNFQTLQRIINGRINASLLYSGMLQYCTPDASLLKTIYRPEILYDVFSVFQRLFVKYGNHLESVKLVLDLISGPYGSAL